MSTFSIHNTSKQTQIADKGKLANSFKARLIGLMNRTSLEDGEALVITRCNSIHMFFMKFAIDVIFTDKDNKVVGLVENIKPYRLSPIFFQSRCAIEAPTGVIAKSKTAVGDQIRIENQ